jgi:uncharacterized membrane protein
MSEALPGTNRIEAFSDGVIAIILTIMILDLKVPNDALAQGFWAGLLGPLLPKLIIYVLSFVVIAIIWVRHHHLLHAARHATRPLLWSNIHLLLWMSIIPITTALLGENPLSPIAVAVYGFVLAANAGAFMLLRWCIARDTRNDGGLMRLHVTMLQRGSFTIVLYALSVPLAFVSVYISLAIFVLMPLLFFLPDLLNGIGSPRHHKPH